MTADVDRRTRGIGNPKDIFARGGSRPQIIAQDVASGHLLRRILCRAQRGAGIEVCGKATSPKVIGRDMLHRETPRGSGWRRRTDLKIGMCGYRFECFSLVRQ